MAGLADPPGLGTNSWFEDAWTRAQRAATPRFAVDGPTSWKPSAASNADRTVSILSGGAWHCGVWDQTTGTETVQLEPNTTQVERFDAVVSTVNWATGTRTFTYVKGSANPPSASPIVQAGAVVRAPGIRYDGLIAIVKVRPGVGVLPATDVFDMRVWLGGSGVLVSNPSLFTWYQDLDVGAAYYQEEAGYGRLYVRSSYGQLMLTQTGAGSDMPALTVNGGWLPVQGHTPRCYKTGHGTVRLIGWFRNGGPFSVGDASGPQIPITLPEGYRPAVQQEVYLTSSYASHQITCAVLPNGQIRMDKDNSGTNYPASSSSPTYFFLDGQEFHLTYNGS